MCMLSNINILCSLPVCVSIFSMGRKFLWVTRSCSSRPFLCTLAVGYSSVYPASCKILSIQRSYLYTKSGKSSLPCWLLHTEPSKLGGTSPPLQYCHCLAVRIMLRIDLQVIVFSIWVPPSWLAMHVHFFVGHCSGLDPSHWHGSKVAPPYPRQSRNWHWKERVCLWADICCLLSCLKVDWSAVQPSIFFQTNQFHSVLGILLILWV